MKRALSLDEYGSRTHDIEKSIGRFLGALESSKSATRHALARYILGEEISGRGDKLTPYAVGVDALNIGEAFDPSTDSRVRVEMKRLRESLADHNRTVRGEGGVTIDIPPRQYRPRFMVEEGGALKLWLKRLTGKSRSLAAALFVLVVPVAYQVLHSGMHSHDVVSFADPDRTASMLQIHVNDLTGSMRSNDTALRLATTLKRLSRVGVKVVTDPERDVEQTPESYLLTIQETGWSTDSRPYDVTRFSVRHAQSGDFVTSLTVRLSDEGPDDKKRNEQISKVASSLASFRGEIMSDYYRRGDMSPTMDCLGKLDDFQTERASGSFLSARQCAEQLIAQGVRVAELHLSLAVLLRHEATHPGAVQSGGSLARALEETKTAMSINPGLAEVYFVAATIHGQAGNQLAMKRFGKLAANMSPFEPRFLAGIGYLLTVSGQFGEGLNLQLSSEAMEPNAPPMRDYGIFLANLALDNELEVVSRGLGMRSSDEPLKLAAYAIAEHAKGKHLTARNALREAERLASVERGDFSSLYEGQAYHPALVRKLVDRLERIDRLNTALGRLNNPLTMSDFEVSSN